MGGGRKKQLASRGQGDFLDRMFDWTEGAFCPHKVTKDTPEPKENLLDYVFTHVESYTCNDNEKGEEPGVLFVEQGSIGKNHTFDRDNSLLEPGHFGKPAQLQTQRKKKAVGRDGDMLDYVFEHVESYVCADDGPEGATQTAQFVAAEQNNDITYKAAKQRVQNLCEPELEIQLYYKPQRS
jgi:hypothetical protein